jgi:hypothetical protein
MTFAPLRYHHNHQRNPTIHPHYLHCNNEIAPHQIKLPLNSLHDRIPNAINTTSSFYYTETSTLLGNRLSMPIPRNADSITVPQVSTLPRESDLTTRLALFLSIVGGDIEETCKVEKMVAALRVAHGWLTVQETMGFLQCHEDVVRGLVRKGHLDSRRRGHVLFIHLPSILDYLAAQPVGSDVSKYLR